MSTVFHIRSEYGTNAERLVLDTGIIPTPYLFQETDGTQHLWSWNGTEWIDLGASAGADADTVDGFHASASPVAGYLLALNWAAQFPSEVIPSEVGADHVFRSQWLQNGFVDRSKSTMTFTNGTLTFEIAPTAGSYVYFYDGVATVKTGDTLVIADSDGQHWVYYNGIGGVLAEVVNPSHAQTEQLIEDECLVAMVYWNTNTNEGYLFDERHGMSMSPSTHRVLHETIGARWANGIGIVDILTDQTGANDTHAQFGNTSGEIYDEDIGHDIGAFAGGDTYECWWWDGTRWQWDTKATFPFLVGGTPQPQYNNFGAGILVEGGNNNFVLTHLFATGAEDGDPIIICGQAVYNSKKDAREGASTEVSVLLLGSLPSPELKPIATVILEIKDAYGNSVNARTVTTGTGHDWTDWRQTPLSPGFGIAVDHGSLGGLPDDDHQQYLLATGARAGATGGAQDFGANGITADVIDESTGAAGVTIEGVLVKDDGIDMDGLLKVDGAADDNVWRIAEIVLDLDFTGTDFDTKTECQAVGLRFSDSDTPFPGTLRVTIGDGWSHSAGNGWLPTSTVQNQGPGILIPLVRPGNWELEAVINYPAQAVNRTGGLGSGYIANSNHVGGFVWLVDGSAAAQRVTIQLHTNDGDDTFTNQYIGAVLVGAGARTFRTRLKNGAISAWDPQDSAWHDYTGRQSAGIAYTAAWAFVQFYNYNNPAANPTPVMYLRSLKLTYLL